MKIIKKLFTLRSFFVESNIDQKNYNQKQSVKDSNFNVNISKIYHYLFCLLNQIATSNEIIPKMLLEINNPILINKVELARNGEPNAAINHPAAKLIKRSARVNLTILSIFRYYHTGESGFAKVTKKTLLSTFIIGSGLIYLFNFLKSLGFFNIMRSLRTFFRKFSRRKKSHSYNKGYNKQLSQYHPKSSLWCQVYHLFFFLLNRKPTSKRTVVITKLNNITTTLVRSSGGIKKAPKNRPKLTWANAIQTLAQYSPSFILNLLNTYSYFNRIKFTQQGFIKLTKKALVSYLIFSIVFVGGGLIYLFGPWAKKTEAAWPALSLSNVFNDNWRVR